MSEGSFRDFLADSFTILRREMPPAYAALCRCLAGHEVTLVVDGESVPVQFESEQALLLSAPVAPIIDVRTTSAAILDLVEACCTLDEAVMADRLLLRGSPRDLLLFHDGLMAYFHGALRAPSFPRLLQSFRSASRTTERPLTPEETG